MHHCVTRRHFLSASAGMAFACQSRSGVKASLEPLRIAAIVTSFSHRSHAHVILENFLEDYVFNGKRTASGMKIVSLYTDQSPTDDMAPQVAKDYAIRQVKTIDEALTLGTDSLAVDGVLSIGEHGDYPHNEKGQHQYPRKQFFDAIVATFRRTGSTAPVFSDKHLSYRWDWCREMVQTSHEMGFPLMAGSSVPLAQRRPEFELPRDSAIESAVSIHAGGVESYDFHALEVLQSILESRRGAESGVESVQFLEGDRLWKAAEEGRWSPKLVDEAMNAELGPGKFRSAIEGKEGSLKIHHGILIRYRDGLRAAVLKVGDGATRWNFACQRNNESKPRATSFYVGPWENRNLFRALSHAIQLFFREQQSPYPVERTLLTSGILAASMDSRFEAGKEIQTEDLSIQYGARDFQRCREMGESWKIITEDMPQPKGIHAFYRS